MERGKDAFPAAGKGRGRGGHLKEVFLQPLSQPESSGFTFEDA